MCIDIVTPACCAHGEHNLTHLGCLTYPFQNISTHTGIDMKLLCTVVMHDDGKREGMSVEEVLVCSTSTNKSIRLSRIDIRFTINCAYRLHLITQS